eukprot:TRINITY_DN10793_c0_g1_i4.p1 TRINITY_DN10793_c0_g1~~TRINITY_DN10793_c0_g1_i4.p1  ORF type:complete len:269 (-),score=60.05 TRINITY_DN10793_c0_g1_i4:159-965(-)
MCIRDSSLLQASRIFWCNWQAGWRLPHLQKLYVRIGVAPTFFSVFAFAQLVDPEGGFEWFTEAASHLFEGYLLICFESLLVLYAGGTSVVACEFEKDASWSHRFVGRNPLGGLWEFSSSEALLQFHRACVMQFTFVLPLTTVLLKTASNGGTAMLLMGVVVKTVSIAIAMRCLLGIYLATSDRLFGFGAVGKFCAVKLMVSLMVTQALLVRTALHLRWFTVPSHLQAEYSEYHSHHAHDVVATQFLARLVLAEMLCMGPVFGLSLIHI